MAKRGRRFRYYETTRQQDQPEYSPSPQGAIEQRKFKAHRAIGVYDWARPKRHRYGSILVDLGAKRHARGSAARPAARDGLAREPSFAA